MTPARPSKRTAKAPPARRAAPAPRKVTTPPSGPVAPTHLRRPTAAWWVSVMRDYELEEHHERLLTFAAQAWDRAEEARELLEAEGITYTDRFGAPRAHPANAVERDNRLSFARLMRELDLEGDPLPSPRPPRRRG